MPKILGAGRVPDVGLLVGLVVAGVVLGPLVGHGFVLSYDMVFVPREPVTTTLFGLTGPAARAVPSDLLVSGASRIVPAAVVEQIVLVLIVVCAAWGAARLLGSAPVLARAAAATAYAWNVYVAERLVIGQWALLIGYAALPWSVAGARAWREHTQNRWRRVLRPLVVAATGGIASSVLCAGTALAVASWPDGRRRLRRPRTGLLVAGGVLLVNAPWLVPSIFRADRFSGDSAGVHAFAANSDTPLGTLGSLVTLGGIWNRDVVPPGRHTWVGALAALVVAAVALASVRCLWRRWSHGAATGLAVASAVGVLIALAGTAPGTRNALGWLVVHVPGAGELRDGQKFVAPLALLEALGFGLAVERLQARVRDVDLGRALAAMGVLVPVAVLPALAWAVDGRLDTARYPHDWSTARRVVDDGPAGAVLVLPWSAYKTYPWTDDDVVLDPAMRWFDRVTVANDAPDVAGIPVRGDDPRVRALDDDVRHAPQLRDPLLRAGIRYVVVERTTSSPTTTDATRLTGARIVLDGPTIRVYDLGTPTRDADEVDPSLRYATYVMDCVAVVVAALVLYPRNRTKA